jgi:acetyl-CoA C-acetyltransferase
MPLLPSYIIAARRSSLGRPGGLHRKRRIAELASPVAAAAQKDSGLSPEQIEEFIVGNASDGGNPARIIALAAGLGDNVAAMTIDRECASGLDAILSAVRITAIGECRAIVAGGAESISTAPWRIAKPRTLYQRPRFLRLEADGDETGEDMQIPESSAEDLFRDLGISRTRQDGYAYRSYLNAETAREQRRFVGEIVPLRANAEEARDESAVEPALEALEKMTPFFPPDGTLTPGNTSSMHDGAAFAVVVSEDCWIDLGKPPALKFVARATLGVGSKMTARAPIAAMERLLETLDTVIQTDIRLIEMSESSAAQALALADHFDFDPGIINPDGGALVRGHALGASGAILITRLFTRMVRARTEPGSPRYGVATLGTTGGMGLAALFEAV